MRSRASQCALLISLLLGALVAHASEQSTKLYSQGLVQFHAGDFSAALQLFDQAVQADGQDMYALYYRGVTHGQLKEFPAAAADLRAVATARPDLQQVPLELGYALLQTGDYAEAAQWLERAQQTPALEAEASLFLGLAHTRLERTEQARQDLQRAAAKNPDLRHSALYYEGVSYYQDRNWSKAEADFDAVVKERPDSEIGHLASAYLDLLHHGTGKPYDLYADAGFQYDSNVVLAPSDSVVKASVGLNKQSDGRAVIDFGGRYIPWQTETMQLSVGYEFFQSLHFSLHDFNLEDHRPNAEFTINTEYARFGMSGRYDFYLLKTSSFLQEAAAQPWATVPEGNIGRTEITYRMRRRDFIAAPYAGLLDAFNHLAGARQYFYLGPETDYLFAGYQFDHDEPINASGNQFEYDGNQVDGGIGWAFPLNITTELSYAFRHERYAAASNGRRDEEHLVTFIAEKPITEYLHVQLAYLGDFNNSNTALYAYDRNIGSVSLGVRF